MIIERWKQCDAYITGESHKEHNTPCQDRTYYKVENGVSAIALADGAGSKKFSHFGAEIVTKKICELLTQNFHKYLLLCEKNGLKEQTYLKNQLSLKKQILDTLQNELNNYSIQENVDYSDLSSTLLFYAYKDGFFIQGHIGDGAIGALKGSSESHVVEVISYPENGAQANITYFVTNPDAIDHLRITGGKVNQLYGIILMSDGPSELLYNLSTGFNENTPKIFHNFNQTKPEEYKRILEEFLSKTVSKFSDDDLSINIMYRESLNTNSQVNTNYIDYFLSNIESDEQIVFLSSYGVMLNPNKPYNNKKFNSTSEVKEYLEWE